MWVVLTMSSWQDEHTEAVGVMFTSSSGEARSIPVLVVVGRASAVIGTSKVGAVL
jgi:hypothetical protein